MYLAFIDRYSGPVWLVVVTGTLGLGLVYFLLYMISDESSLLGFSGNAQLVGTLIMWSVLPAYLIAMVVYLHRETRLMLDKMRPIGPDSQDVLYCLEQLKLSWFPLILVAVVFGVQQNFFVLEGIAEARPFSLIDVTAVADNAFLWMVVGIQIAWRFPLVLALRRYARGLRVNLYETETVHPVSLLAARDVLVIASALALMPLQALDASFRWVNYQAGLSVGIPAAVVLLFLTLSGIRYSVIAAKRERVDEIQSEIEATDKQDMVRLELLSAHRARILGMSN